MTNIIENKVNLEEKDKQPPSDSGKEKKENSYELKKKEELKERNELKKEFEDIWWKIKNMNENLTSKNPKDKEKATPQKQEIIKLLQEKNILPEDALKNPIDIVPIEANTAQMAGQKVIMVKYYTYGTAGENKDRMCFEVMALINQEFKEIERDINLRGDML